ncbi:MAG TPA: hypothetical protein ENN07_06410 [candidate division Zixibacteria bacterium]|nr:hypothetical protein [candidate division Zixibacteria bacterium]
MFNKFLIVLFVLALSIPAVAQDTSLTDSQFVLLYVDLSFAAEQFLSDSSQLAQVQDSIFLSHSITREHFFSYKAKLDESPERWSGIWEMIAEELTKREAEIQAREKTNPKDEKKNDKKK